MGGGGGGGSECRSEAFVKIQNIFFIGGGVGNGSDLGDQGGGGGGGSECRSEAFVKIQNIFFIWGGGGGGGWGTGRICGIRVDVNEEVTFFCDLFIFFGGRGWESDQMFGWGRGGGVR